LTQPKFDAFNVKLEEQQDYLVSLINPIGDQLYRLGIHDESIANIKTNVKSEVARIYKTIDDMGRGDLKTLDDRCTRLEDSIVKLQQQQVEKFNKLESDFRNNVNNMESKNMDIMNQARDLGDKLNSIEKNKKHEDPTSVIRNSQNTEPEQVKINRNDVVSPTMSNYN